MRTRTLWLNVVLLLALLLPGVGRPTAAALPEDDGAMLAAAPVAVSVRETLRNSPVMFIENVGQFDEGARFQVRGGSGTLWLADDALWITVVERSAVSGQRSARWRHLEDPYDQNKKSKIVNLRLSFPNANPNARLEPFDRLETTVSYFLGNDPDGWRPAVPVWGGVRYVDLYPGIDLEVTSEGGQFVQRLRVHPGADLNQVQLRVEGAEAVELTGTEGLRLSTAVGDYALPLLMVVDAMLDTTPTIFTADARTFDIIPPLTLSPRHLVTSSSAIQNQDDPSHLLYSSFLGGLYNDVGRDIAVDSAGNAYVTGETASTNFPATGGPDLIHNGSYDAFVAKVNAAGTGLVYASFLGGSDTDEGYGIAVDGAGNAYVTGGTRSPDFPAVIGPDLTYGGDSDGDAFVAKVNAAGTSLIYAGFLGGSEWDISRAIAVDGAGNAYITGHTLSTDFPATGGTDLTHNGGWDAFVAKVNAAGTGLVYASFLGGSGFDGGDGITVDGVGNVYVTGQTSSPNFPVTAGPDLIHNGSGDAFVVKVNTAGTELIYAGFLGGSADDGGNGIAIDSAGNAYVTGYTLSTDFPVVSGPDLAYNGGFSDAFVVKVNAAGTGLIYAGFLGGSSGDFGNGIAVDDAENAYVTGQTYSPDFPATGGPDLTYNGGDYDAFVVKVNTTGTGLAYASFLGGSEWDEGHGITVDGAGNAYVTGGTTSTDFPATLSAFDATYNGNYDAFVAKLAVAYAISGHVAEASGNAISGVVISGGTGHTATTDNNGNYRLTGLTAGTYTLTPTKAGWVFTPSMRAVTLPPSATGQNFTMLHPPVSVTLSLSGSISFPDNLAYVDPQGLTTIIAFPTGAVTAMTTIVLTPTLATAGADLAFAGHAFNIEAYQGDVRQPGFTFEQPATVTIQYSRQDVRMISDESHMALYRWEDGAWVDAACGAYTRQLSEKWLSAPICGLSRFALLGPTHRVYLPLVLRLQ